MDAVTTPPPALAPQGSLRDGGLDDDEVRRSRSDHGPNLMPRAERPRHLTLFVRQLTHLLAVLLWIAAGLAALGGMPVLAATIAVIVILNAVFAFWQEYRADRDTSASAVRAMWRRGCQQVRSRRLSRSHANEVAEGRSDDVTQAQH